MKRLHFADNTVLENFCRTRRLQLLEDLLDSRGTWTATVAVECTASTRVTGLEDLVNVGGFLGEPISPETEDEFAAVQRHREFLRIPGDGPEKHLGEAETLALVELRSIHAIVLTDDTGAMRLANRLSISVATTADLFRLAVRAERLDAQSAWDDLVSLQTEHHRFLPRASPSFADLLAACGGVVG